MHLKHLYRTAEPMIPPRAREMFKRAYVGWRPAMKAFPHDVRNRCAYGYGAPSYAGRVWINPLQCNEVLLDGSIRRGHTGCVLDGEWDDATAPLSTMEKIRACELHWEHKLTWEETGIYEHMLHLIREKGRADGCRTLDDIVSRYARLDALFDQISQERILKSRTELQQSGFRAMGEVYVHVGRGPRLLFGRGGNHRLAAARIAGLQCIPAQLGVVHRRQVEGWTEIATPSSRRPSECKP